MIVLDTAADEECAVCLDGYDKDNEIRETSCGHMFHAACVDRWFARNRSCPMCTRAIR